MSETGLTTIQLKKINKSKVYHYIYQQHTTSKLQIVQELQMGLSTVSQNLTLLEQEGYIQRNGYFDSTGGRKAQTIQIVPDFRISIGIGILKEMFHMTAIDLYGHILDMETISLSYADTDAYYKQMTEKIQAFITSHHYDPQKILGISIATQGITSSDHTTVTYGKILHNTGMNVDHFSSRLPFACHLEHDSKSAAHLELWNHPELDSAIVILLNRNLGGAIITDRHIHQGSTMHSGTLEHMCVNPDGPLCYCGNRGCLETYCSADALEQASGMPIPDFFHSLREISRHTADTDTDEKKSSQISQIWEDYLNHLAFAMKNLNLIIDAPMILSGYLASFLTEEDTQYLLKQINAATPFPLRKEQILVGTYGQYTQAAGAALYYVETFLNTL
ncbi:ROK family protein [Lachnospiraceae bacterium HCP1S3_A8]|nr:ROK family protein [Lachnospiraceae bacterium]